MLHEEGDEGKVHCSIRGVSPQGAERLSQDPLRRYLLSSGERWGALMVFPDLRRSDVVAAWQRDPAFHEFRDVLRGEGLRTLIVVGLQVREKSYGALILGFRRTRSFEPQELRVALAIGNQVSVAIENWSLNRAAERRDEELRILHRVGEALRATFDMNAQIEILRRELTGLMGATNFGLALQDTPEGPLEVVVPFERRRAAGHRARRAGEFAGAICAADPPAAVGGERCSGHRAAVGVGSHESRASRPGAACPSISPMDRWGCWRWPIWSASTRSPRPSLSWCKCWRRRLPARWRTPASSRRNSGAPAILALLNELGRKASSVLNPQELLPSICRQIRNAFGYDLARIEMLDPGREELVVEAEAGYGPELMGRRIRVGEGLAGVAADSGEPVLANSVVKEPRYIALHPGIRSALSLPLKYREEMMGVLSLESRQAYAFSQQDVLTLRTLADQLAIALHNARAYQVALEQAITDGLTGLKTHRYFMEALDREWRRSTRSGHMFSVIMMDLDGFKQVNDRHGHLEGDKVLTAVANLLNDRVRQSNVVARYGGDEFAIMLPETRTEQAEILAERLRASIESDRYLAAHGVTASFGIATFPVHGPTQEEILRVADSGMYLAKHQEGNRVRVASLSVASAQADWERQLLEAYLGVTMKRMFSTGPEAFDHYLERFPGRHAEGQRRGSLVAGYRDRAG